MGVIASIDSQVVEAAPGVDTTCTVQVRNTGMVVDQVLLEVLGDSKPWASIEPDRLNLMPDATGTARITFHPPRSSSVRAGEVPFAVRAVSLEDPEGSTVEESRVTVGSFTEINAEIVPKTSHGRRSGKHRLSVENRGNGTSDIRLAAADPDDALEFRFTPDALSTEPGTATFVKLRAAPRRRFAKGPSKSLPFQVMAFRDAGEPITVDATMLQRQMMPEWLVPAVAILAAAVVALVALWYLVFKPAVHSAASEAVTNENRQLAANAQKASSAASQASAAASNANAAAAAAGGAVSSGAPGDPAGGPGGSGTGGSGPAGVGNAAGSGGPSGSRKPSASLTPTPATAPGNPVSRLIRSDVAPSTTKSYSYELPRGEKTLTVSDIVMENPAGDSGTLHIRSGGTALFDFGLDDFRNLDYHFVQPLVFTVDQPLTVVVECKNPGTTHCTAGLSFSGEVSR